MGINKINHSVADFWYRRVNEVALLICLAIGAIWGLTTFGITGPVLQPLVVSLPTAIMTGITFLVGIVALIMQRKKVSTWMTVLLTACVSATILSAIHDTGDMESPFRALWVLSAVFAAVAGLASFVPVAVCVAVYAGYLYLSGTTPPLDWVVFALVIILPLLIGLFIWLRRHHTNDQSNQTVNELASELDQEANKSSIIINSITDGVVLLDKNGTIELINPAAEKIVGWGSGDAAKLDYRSVLKIVNPKDKVVDETLDPIQECMRRQESIITDTFSLRTSSGKQVPASIMVTPLSGEAGVVVVFRDVTAQRAEERDQAEFVSTASHEMRTPVAAIEGYLGLALNPQTAAIDEKARTYLLKAQESAKHLGRLFQDLLDISKVEDGRLETELTVINIPKFVRDLLEDFRGQVAEKSLTLIYAPDTSATGGNTVEPLLYAKADQSHLQEVLSNLIGNAIKYTKEGSVTVDVTADDDHVFVSVKDTGIGIPAEDIPHLFQKFYRVDNTDTREIGGTGLGLYLARRLVETMRGHLNIQSEYGKGSTFSVELPRISREQAEQPDLTVGPQAPDSTPAQPAVTTATAAAPAPKQTTPAATPTPAPAAPTAPVAISAPQAQTVPPTQPAPVTPSTPATQSQPTITPDIQPPTSSGPTS